MTLVVVAEPETESELAVMLCVLEGEGIRAFVQGYAFGAMFPGARIGSYNSRRVMVNDTDRDAAVTALAVLRPPLPDQTSWTDRLRILIEGLFLGWVFPGGRRKRSQVAESERTPEE